jgi:GxxExxY protein
MAVLGKNIKKNYEPLDLKLEEIGKKIVNAAYYVHKALGPGLLEKIYEICLCHELNKAGLKTERQLPVPVEFDGLLFDEGFRLDVLVENEIIVEIKAVDKTNPVWNAQILSYLRLMKKRLGYLINFNVPVIKDGIKRIIL